MRADEAQKAFQALAPDGTKVKLSEVGGTAIFYAVGKDGKKSEECLFDPYELAALTATGDGFLAAGEKLFGKLPQFNAAASRSKDTTPRKTPPQESLELGAKVTGKK